MTDEATKAETPEKTRHPFEDELSALKKLEAKFQAAHNTYEASTRKAGPSGEPAPVTLVPHLVDAARRELGKAHGGMVAAIQALDAFLSRDEVAKTAYAAELAKVTK